MEELIYDSFAKINLSLDVLDKREDGYHNIKTIFQEINLRDGIYVKKQAGGEIELTCDNKLVPVDEDNYIVKVWKLMKPLCKEDPGIRVHLEKKIPIAAGLAGGSSNAAAMIKALNELWNLNLSRQEMMDLGVKLGADIPFFFIGKTALGEGKGNILTEMKPFSGRHILLVNTGYGVSTSFVYKHLEERTEEMGFDEIISAIDNGNDQDFYPILRNRLESVTIKINPDIGKIKEKMINYGARASLMCGSGPTVFGIFDDQEKLEKAFFYFKDKFDLVFACETR